MFHICYDNYVWILITRSGGVMSYRLTPGDYKTFGAAAVEAGVVFTFACEPGEDAFLLFYDRRTRKLSEKILIPNLYRWGGVYSVTVSGLDFDKLMYLIGRGETIFCDPHAPVIFGREKWMDKNRFKQSYQVYGGFFPVDEIWEEPITAVEPCDMVMYRIHTRGFTMQHGLPASEKGNYKGIISLIPYLKELGITTLEFMPLYEFEEVRYRTHLEMDDSQKTHVVVEEPYGTNYWGYGDSYYYAPKRSYFPGIDPVEGMRELVSAVHKAGMEFVMEFSFSSSIPARELEMILCYWVGRYHIDGFHLLGDGLPVSEVVDSPFLMGIKIFHDGFSQETIDSQKFGKRLFAYNTSFMYPVRRLVNHLDGSVAELAGVMRRQNSKFGFINYSANTSGFTLFDSVCYGEKHNEANGEDNTDGNNYNCSNNHGVEGPSTLRGVKRSRMSAVRSMMALTVLSQAIPLINCGDEVLNSQKGNNNPYCQDNAIGWANFKKKKDSDDFCEYVRNLIKFRHDHPILSQEEPFRENDYRHKGIPDLSYHGREPWIMGIGAEKKGLGILYCGDYGREVCEDVLICLNFYYGEETFALPKLPGERKWYFVNNTTDFEFSHKGEPVKDQHSVIVPGSSISIYIGKSKK